MLRRTIQILSLVFLMTTLNSCYIVRYKKLQKDYAKVRKEYLKENSKTLAVKQKFLQKKDSVTYLVSQTKIFLQSFKANNKLSDSLSTYIISHLGKCWTDQDKAACNTAKNIKQLNKNEKEIYTCLNLARQHPSLFAEMYIAPFMSSYSLSQITDSNFRLADTGYLWHNSYYDNSLYLRMKKMQPLNILQFNQKCWESAECHSISVGKAGLVTHERQKGCNAYFSGECCHYGRSDAMEIIVDLLIDTGVVSLGHRDICLGSYSYLGVSQKPHITWSVNTTLDFK